MKSNCVAGIRALTCNLTQYLSAQQRARERERRSVAWSGVAGLRTMTKKAISSVHSISPSEDINQRVQQPEG